MGVGVGALAVGDGDELSGAFPVGLGSADVQQQSGWLVLDVGQVQGDEFADPQGRGEAK